jgi:hypothetical protein
MITKEELRRLFVYREGALYYRHSATRPVKKGQKAGTTYNDYTKIEIAGKRYSSYLLIWIYHKGDVPEGWKVVRESKKSDSIGTLKLKAIR